MTGWLTAPVLLISVAILVVLAVRAAWVIRSEKNQLRGSPPGKGDHVVDANYNSGLGGQTGQFRVPKDPEEYARRFVPRSKR